MDKQANAGNITADAGMLSLMRVIYQHMIGKSSIKKKMYLWYMVFLISNMFFTQTFFFTLS